MSSFKHEVSGRLNLQLSERVYHVSAITGFWSLKDLKDLRGAFAHNYWLPAVMLERHESANSNPIRSKDRSQRNRD
jgi:hypothetical protein